MFRLLLGFIWLVQVANYDDPAPNSTYPDFYTNENWEKIDDAVPEQWGKRHDDRNDRSEKQEKGNPKHV